MGEAGGVAAGVGERAPGGRPEDGRWAARNAWWAYLIAMLGVGVAYVVAHFTGPAAVNSGPVYNLIGGSAVVAIIIGTRMHRPSPPLPWYLLAVGQTLFLISNILAYNYEHLFGEALPFPSIADPFHIAFYPFLVAGMLLLVFERHERAEGAERIDALMVTLALATLLWVYLIAPYVHQQSLPLLQRLTSVAYPAADIMLLGVIARVAAGSRRREPALWFLLAAAVVLLLSDAVYGWKLLGGGYTMNGAMASGWAVYFTLLGTAALHPSMRLLNRPGPREEVRLTPARLSLMAVASFTAPLVIVVREIAGQPLDIFVLVGSCLAMFSLVLLRLSGIVRANERGRRREAALRRAGEALVQAPGRDEIYAAATAAASSLAGGGVGTCIYECGGGGELRPVGLGGAAGAPIARGELPAPDAEGLYEIERDGERAYLAPLQIRDQLAGALAVVSVEPLRSDARESLAMLASAVALALHSAELAEETLRRRSERRLSSLIENASDVVCILDGEGAVQYMSPSVARMFGHEPAAAVGRSLTALVHPEERGRVESYVAAAAAQPAGLPLAGEFRLRHADGHWCDVEASAANLLAEEAVAGIVLNMRDISERKAFQAELEHQAFHDTLTGLPNRALFRNRVEHALASQRRTRVPVAVLFLDVDDFKNVNDSLGHAAGDEVLMEISRRIDEVMRSVDTAARLGGDEFAVLLAEADGEMQSVEIAQRIMGAIGAPMSLGGRAVSIATSVGIAYSEDGASGTRDADELLRNADAAMYMAKETGKGRYQIFEPEMHARALARLELKADLQRAIDEGEFTLRYQPIMDLTSGEMAGMEALVRWEHPLRGTVPPLEFVPLLEDTGLIVQVGTMVMREACAWAARMQQECPRDPDLSMAVNVSVAQLQRPEFIEEVRAAFTDAGIEPVTLTLELTESVMMQDMELSLLRLNQLRALGVKLAIDDFGTGYSSLNYVRQFPVDILKIDRSFLADRNPEVTELTAAIVQVARIFKLKAVAEGIESTGQLEQLRGIDCDFGQGFHFAEPLTAEQVLDLARGRAAERGAV